MTVLFNLLRHTTAVLSTQSTVQCKLSELHLPKALVYATVHPFIACLCATTSGKTLRIFAVNEEESHCFTRQLHEFKKALASTFTQESQTKHFFAFKIYQNYINKNDQYYRTN